MASGKGPARFTPGLRTRESPRLWVVGQGGRGWLFTTQGATLRFYSVFFPPGVIYPRMRELQPSRLRGMHRYIYELYGGWMLQSIACGFYRPMMQKDHRKQRNSNGPKR